MLTKHISVLKAFEKELDRNAAALLDGVAPSKMETRKVSMAYLQLAKRMTEAGHNEEVLAICRKVVQVNPDDPDANYHLLIKLEQFNRTDEAWAALQALEQQCDSLYDSCRKLYLLKARLEYRRGNLQISREMLENFLTNDSLHSHRAMAYGWLGKVLDSLGEYDAAMNAFHACNRQISSSPAGSGWIRKSRDVFSDIDTSLRWYGDKTSFGWQSAVIHDQLAAPILLVGFPRSGTTLLDQILNSHSALTTLEEKPGFSGIREKFYGSEDKLLSLHNLSSNELSDCRQMYWSNIAKYLGRPVDGLSVVDKLPLNIRYLDIFFRLFPAGKVIVALRDPRDVVLSNYMQIYELNPEMATNLSLASSARFYEKVMQLYLLFRKFIPGNIYEIKYEDLVCDFEGESGRLLDFLGLEWDGRLERYHENAKQRFINTPSYDQVTKPIYRDAVGRWKRYERHLEEIGPTLQPFVQEFGYPT